MAGRDVHRFDEKESEKAPGFGGGFVAAGHGLVAPEVVGATTQEKSLPRRNSRALSRFLLISLSLSPALQRPPFKIRGLDIANLSTLLNGKNTGLATSFAYNRCKRGLLEELGEKEREREKNDIKKEDRASVREERHRRGNLQNGGGRG